MIAKLSIAEGVVEVLGGVECQFIDFGLAHEAGDKEGRLTIDNAVIGTPAYMSPERIGTDEVNAKSDLFGLGLFCMK